MLPTADFLIEDFLAAGFPESIDLRVQVLLRRRNLRISNEHTAPPFSQSHKGSMAVCFEILIMR